MPVYQYKGQHYDLATDDPNEAKRKIRTHLKEPLEDEKSYGERVVTEGLPAAANMIGDVALSIPAGIRGAGEAIATGSMARGLEGYESSMEQLREVSPRFRGPGQAQADQDMGEMFGKVFGYVGDLGESTVTTPGGPMNLAPERLGPNEGAPGVRTATEALAQLAPLPGTRALGNIKARKIAGVKAEALEKAKGIQESRLDLEQAERMTAESIPEEAFSGAIRERRGDPSYRAGYDQLDNQLTPNVARQYGIKDQAVRDRLQAEMDAEMQAIARSEQERTMGPIEYKPELLETRADPARLEQPRIYDIERTQRPPMAPEQVSGPSVPREPVGRGELPFPAPEAAMSFQNKAYPQPGLSMAEKRVPKAQPTPLEMPGMDLAGNEGSMVSGLGKPGFLRSLEEVMATRDIGNANIVNLGMGIDAVAWIKKYGPGITKWAKEQKIPEVVYQGIPKGVDPNKPSYWFTTSLEEAVMWAERNGPGGRVAVADSRQIQGHRNKSDRNDFPNSEHIYSGDTKSRPILREFALDGKITERGAIDSDVFLNAAKRFTGLFKAAAFRQRSTGKIIETGPIHNTARLPNRSEEGWEAGFTDTKGNFYNREEANQLLKKSVPVIGGFKGKAHSADIFPRQRGAWTPFSKKDQFADWYKNLESKGVSLPESVARQVWDEAQGAKSKKPVVASDRVEKTQEKVLKHVLDKETRELYFAGDRTFDQLKADLRKLHEEGGSDIILNNRLVPPNFNAQRHTLTRYVAAKVNKAFTDAINWGETLRIGEQFSNLGGRSIHKDSPQGLWDALPRKSQDVIRQLSNKLTDKNMPYSPETARELVGRELTPLEEKALMGHASIGKAILKDIINPLRKQRGESPIEGRNFYGIPATWSGRYLYFIKDKVTNEVIEPVGTHFRPDSVMGKMFNRRLKKLLDAHGLVFDKANAKALTSQPEFSLSGMEVLLERMDPYITTAEGKLVRKPGTKPDKYDTVREEVAKLVTDFSYGAARGLERKGKGGYRGTEEGRAGVREFERVTDEMMRKAVNIKASIEIGKMYRELMNDPDVNLFPDAKRAALAHMDHALGDQWTVFKALDDAVASGLDKVGLPPDLVRDIAHLSGNLSVRLLMTGLLVSQMAIQFTQATFAIPKVYSLFGDAISKNPAISTYYVVKSMAKAVKDVFNPKLMKDLAAEGAFEPIMMKEAGFGAEYAGARKVRNLAKLDVGILQAIESNAVRKPAALFTESALKELGLDGKELIEVTKGLTEDYMVAWDRHKKSPLTGATGVMGDVMGRITSFPITWLASFLEYGKKALTKGDFMPLTTFLYLNYLYAGLLGFAGVREMDAAIEMINSFTESAHETATEFILKYFKTDSVRYGALSAATGTNIGASAAAASVTQQGVPPTINLWTGVVKTMDILYREMFKDPTFKPTPEEKREAFKPLMFRSLWGALEDPKSWLGRSLGTVSEKVPMMTNARGKGILERDKFDTFIRYLGTYSLRESDKKRENYIVNRNEQRLKDQRKNYMERLAGHLIEGGKFQGSFIERAKALQYQNSNEIYNGLKNHIISKFTEEQARDIRQLRTPRQQRMYMLYQQLGGTDRELQHGLNTSR